MSLKQAGRGAWLGAAVVAAVLVAGCANPRPAPVVHRTGIPQAPAPQAATVPSQPEPLPGQQPGQPDVAVLPGAEETPGVIATPIPSGTIEAAPIHQGTAPVDPNLKTGPSGLKRPYGEMASIDRRNLDAGSGVSVSPPAVVSTAASPSAQPAPQSKPPTTVATAPATIPPAPAAASAGGTGTLDGVPFGWPVAGS